jgi:hypothetical protein
MKIIFIIRDARKIIQCHFLLVLSILLLIFISNKIYLYFFFKELFKTHLLRYHVYF